MNSFYNLYLSHVRFEFIVWFGQASFQYENIKGGCQQKFSIFLYLFGWLKYILRKYHSQENKLFKNNENDFLSKKNNETNSTNDILR